MLLPVVTLKSRRNSRHPWIFRKMVRLPRGLRLEPGSLVEVRNPDGNFAGRAFFHPENTIALRLVSEDPGRDFDESAVAERLAAAKRLRETAMPLSAPTDSFRLVNAEADLLPGLVVDKFNDVLVIEPHTAGWLHLMDWVVSGLGALYPGSRVVVRPDRRVEEKEGVSFAKAAERHPAPDSALIEENGIRYRVDFKTGHKTGFFLDQRDNRALVAGLSRGRKVLDLCCYTGAFSLSAWKGGAKFVVAVDLDEKAIAAARENARINGADSALSWIHRDIFDELRDPAAAKDRFDLVILDPPKLAGGQEEVEKALKTYLDFNKLAIAATRPGCLFVTCSCSGAVPAERWRQTVRHAAAASGRGLSVFLNTGPGPDHPVHSDFPQGQYLKVMFARVD
ncbi:MAG: class I SAM-dependent rRNA methyltransferase [Planctomycetota bacterium]|jgi:23S rRNA (cytosine1962-C5)-methyltransferase|nr:class I SAM-dependent rRNA methyltransferase [Planctomycetota bacterium]